VRIPAGLPRNQRVSVRLSEVGSMLVGELQGAPIIIARRFPGDAVLGDSVMS
jgi:hypothetical protein